MNHYRLLLVLCLSFGLLVSGAQPATPLMPVTAAAPAPAADSQTVDLPDLPAFIRQVANGQAQQVTGIYVEGVLALPVIQQPSGQPAYVSTAPETVTQFSAASDFGSLGFLAHNTLAGAHFFDIRVGDLIVLIYGDGHTRSYQVTGLRRFQATHPTSPYSNFIDLDQGGMLTYSDLFYQTYGVAGQLVMQTCIAANGNDSWGRLFVLAMPYVPEPSGAH
ncbi:MAG: hypothetical protein ABWK53_03025 [Anaerolineales bacterium]